MNNAKRGRVPQIRYMVNSKAVCLSIMRKFGNGKWLVFVPFATSNRRPSPPKVFLPAAGNRNGTDVNNVGSNGNYWSSSANGNNNANYLNFNSNNVNTNNNNRNNGQSVRLVRGLEE